MLEESLQPFMDWIQAYPTWTGLIIALISFSESLVGLGFLVPGVLLMTSIGALVGHGILPLWETLAWAIVGAIAGDGLSFWIGHRYNQHVRELWPFSQYPQWLERGHRFFAKHGGKSIILGRFLGPIRPIVPVIAGMMAMPSWQFYIYNTLSALAWAPLYSLPGYLFGISLGVLNIETTKRLVVIIILLALSLWALYRCCALFLGYAYRLFQAILQQSTRWGLRGWPDRSFPGPYGQLEMQVLWLCCAALYGGIQYGYSEDFWRVWDDSLWQITTTFQATPWVYYAKILALGGDPIVLGLCALFSLALLYALGQTTLCVWGCAVMVGAVFIQYPLVSWDWSAMMQTTPVWATMLWAGLFLRISRIQAWPYRQGLLRGMAFLYLLVVLSQLYLGLYPLSVGTMGLVSSIWMLLTIEIVYRMQALPAARPVSAVYSQKIYAIAAVLCAGMLLTWIIRGVFFVPEPFEEFQTIPATRSVTPLAWQKGNIEALGLRHNFWGKPLLDLNVESALSIDDLITALIPQGWVVLEPTTFLRSLQWLSPLPHPLVWPDIPHFNHNQRPLLILVKETDQGRYLLRLWSSWQVLENPKGPVPIFVGTVLTQSFVRVLPFVHVYRALPEYKKALDVLAGDLKGRSGIQIHLQALTPQETAYRADQGWDWHILFMRSL